MQPQPHRIVTPSGTRHGIPVRVDGDRVTYKTLPASKDQSAEAVEGDATTTDPGDDTRSNRARDLDGAEELDDQRASLAAHLPTMAPYPRSIVISERGGLRAIDRLRRGASDPRR